MLQRVLIFFCMWRMLKSHQSRELLIYFHNSFFIVILPWMPFLDARMLTFFFFCLKPSKCKKATDKHIQCFIAPSSFALTLVSTCFTFSILHYSTLNAHNAQQCETIRHYGVGKGMQRHCQGTVRLHFHLALNCLANKWKLFPLRHRLA